MLLGLTGGYCAGKNAVAALLAERGYLCVDVDRLGHEALAGEEGARAVRARFGEDAIGPDGGVDRKALAAAVFGDPAALADLEAIVHPLVYRLLWAVLAPALAEGRELCINAALLYRMPEAASCDAILEVRAPLPLRLRRGRERDGLPPRRVLERIWSQRSFWRRRREAQRPVVVVRNGGSLADLEAEVGRALARAESARKAFTAPPRLPIG